ncbi:hypothetical protein Ancab_020897 [Ancistrocladus abbreviatus]
MAQVTPIHLSWFIHVFRKAFLPTNCPVSHGTKFIFKVTSSSKMLPRSPFKDHKTANEGAKYVNHGNPYKPSGFWGSCMPFVVILPASARHRDG